MEYYSKKRAEIYGWNNNGIIDCIKYSRWILLLRTVVWISSILFFIKYLPLASTKSLQNEKFNSLNEIIKVQGALDYFVLKEEQKCNYLLEDLTLDNENNIFKESILYIDSSSTLCGIIKLQYFGILKIVVKGDLYLNNVTFLNTFQVEITSGHIKNNKILPFRYSHISLSSALASRFYIHDVSNIDLKEDILACSEFKLYNILNIFCGKFTQLLSEKVEIKLANSINWKGTVSSCQKKESQKISIFASRKINLSQTSMLLTKDLSISGGPTSQIHISGLLASTNSLFIHCNLLRFFDGANIKFSGPLATFECNNLITDSDTFFYFQSVTLKIIEALLNGKIFWNDTLSLDANSKAETASSFVDISKGTLLGPKLVFNNLSSIKTTKEIVSGANICIWKSKTLDLNDDLKWITKCHVSVDILQVNSCNFLRHKNTVIKAKSMKLVISDDCKNSSFTLHGMIDILHNTVIRSSKPSKIIFENNSILKTGSLTIDSKFSDLQCHGCRIIVNSQDLNSIELNKLIITSDTFLNITDEKLPVLSRKQIYDCYEPVFVSERCTVQVVQSNSYNRLVTMIASYENFGYILIEGESNLNVSQIVVRDAAFVVNGKLKYEAQLDQLTIESTKNSRRIILSDVYDDRVVRSSSGSGKFVRRIHWSRNNDALKYFDKYDVARDYGLISLSEWNECQRGRKFNNVFCPIYVEGNTIIRNMNSLQSIFHAKSHDGANISNLKVGISVPDEVLALIYNNTFDVSNLKVDANTQWCDEVGKHKTLLKNSELITSLKNVNDAINSAVSRDSKVAVLKRLRLSADVALNLDNIGIYEIFDRAKMQVLQKEIQPDSLSAEFIWNILDYPKEIREFLHNDTLLLKLFKCTKIEFPTVSLANQNLMVDLLNDLVFATSGKLTGISSATLFEHLVDNTCSIYNKLEAIGAKSGVPLNYEQKELFEAPGVWPFWLNNCPGEHKKCITLELALSEKIINGTLSSGAKLSADEYIKLNSTHLELGMNGIIVAGTSIKARLVNNTKLDGRILASEIDSHVEGNLLNTGIISGNTVSVTANNMTNLGLIKASKILAIQALGQFIEAGFLESEGPLSLDVLHNLTLLSLKMIAKSKNVYGISENVAHITSVIAKGALKIKANGGILNIAAEVVGESVFIESDDETIVVPLELYNEGINAGKYYYESYKNSKFVKSVIKSTRKKEDSGCINSTLLKEDPNYNTLGIIQKEMTKFKNEYGTTVISGKKGVQILGSDISSSGNMVLVAEEGNINVKGVKNRKETILTTSESDLFSSREEERYLYDEEVTKSIIETGSTLHSYSLKDQEWAGASIKTDSTRLAAGTPEYKANINIVPMQKTKINKVTTKTTKFSMELRENEIIYEKEMIKARQDISVKHIPTTIEVKGKFRAYSSGKFNYLYPAIIDKSEDELGNIDIKINANKTKFEAVFDIEASHSYTSESETGIGIYVNNGEFSFKGSNFYESSEMSLNRMVYTPPIPLKGRINLNTSTYTDAGISYFAKALQINAESEIHGTSMNAENKTDISSVLEAGVKFGIRSNLGSITDYFQNIASTNYNRPESVINSAFEGYKLYFDVLKLLSAGHGLSWVMGGFWFYAQKNEKTEKSKNSSPRPTIIVVEDLKINSTHLEFHGTQILANNFDIDSKHVKGLAVKNTVTDDMSNDSIDLEVPIAGTVSPNIQRNHQKANEKSEFYSNVQIYVTNRLNLNISGTADLKGVSISAQTLEANINELILVSLQNIAESDSDSKNFGLGLDNEGKFGGLNAGKRIRNHSRRVVDSLSMLVGRESANIVVAQALYLNGALIANADHNSNDEFTDHGNLNLTIGQLFAQHIYDYDEGITLGAAASCSGFSKSDRSSVDFMPTFGNFYKKGITRGTIGKGNICIGNRTFDKNDVSENSVVINKGKESLNRDLKEIQEFTTLHNLETINAYFSTIDTEKLKENIIRNKEGNVDFAEISKSFFHSISSLMRFFSLQKKVKEEMEVESELKDSTSETIVSDKKKATAEDRDDLIEKLQKIEDKILNYVKAKFGKERAKLVHEMSKQLLSERLDELENIKDSQYIIEQNKLFLRLPNAGIVPVSLMNSDFHLDFDIVDLETVKKFTNNFRKYVLKIGKHFVRINPYAVMAMYAYEAGNFLVKSGHLINVAEFVKEATKFDKTRDQQTFFNKKSKEVKVSTVREFQRKLRDKRSNKGTTDPGQHDPNSRKPDEKNKKDIEDDSEFQQAKSKGKIHYEDAPYHHQQSRGRKSPSPKTSKNEDALKKVLKKSVKVSKNSDRRIGFDEENNEFIVFDATEKKPDGSIEYHGHVRKNLNQKMKNVLNRLLNAISNTDQQ